MSQTIPVSLFRPQVDLTSLNTLGLPARADYLAQPDSLTALQAALAEAAEAVHPVLLLGGGSNLMLPPQLHAWVIQPCLNGMACLQDDGDHVIWRVEAGVNWHQLVMQSVQQGLYGLENLALIPGQVGAAPIQNIGAYGVELKDVLLNVEVMAVADGQHTTLSVDDCALGYRDSRFKHDWQDQWVITALHLRLRRQGTPVLGYGDLAERLAGQVPTPEAIANTVIQIRQEKLPDPKVLGNAGSFFKNPIIPVDQATRLRDTYPQMPQHPTTDGQVKIPAAWLIDQCGLKGLRHGAFGVHQRQPLVLVHFGGGDLRGLLSLAHHIQHHIADRFGIHLEPEPRLIQ
ncbi:UDP-N-acetylenolpyruvoylglucosamine reductase [Terasakiispira papahanaumokuakeensis]|uniref:UDP-N-acetylenolpyruvoylglucosamine reductase n=1 Tax=Terasakiispira papahanaumokuakeensis TaxID=197479 RepID=A0A1E2V7L8_9GAMM|nr:UDP-N-acetylmuramate dehydrogenase [Terasakiispira papahanaumokuakeensis]ODC02977.1 UDP-N-acetylenolpyruvoylglucosamine reductase [Terasakiispira papahanaumokuakeensis]